MITVSVIKADVGGVPGHSRDRNQFFYKI
ncbi:MAG: fructose 1,6-bisphosphatase [Methanomicrobia archaeon]|nr:fructose 1,6-bisphosphatase [Methanomicrobia archaeon]